MRYDLVLLWDEQRGEARQAILSALDGEGQIEARLGSVEAESWLHAKQALGFELTELQERLLDLDEDGRAAAVFSERWAGMGNLLLDRPHIQYSKGWISNPVQRSEPRELNKAQRGWNARRGL